MRNDSRHRKNEPLTPVEWMFFVFLALLILTFLNGCQVTTKNEQCIKNSEGQCTDTITIKHVVEVVVPEVLLNDCTAKFAGYAEPERTALINQCTAAYITDLLSAIQAGIPKQNGG